MNYTDKLKGRVKYIATERLIAHLNHVCKNNEEVKEALEVLLPGRRPHMLNSAPLTKPEKEKFDKALKQSKWIDIASALGVSYSTVRHKFASMAFRYLRNLELQ